MPPKNPYQEDSTRAASSRISLLIKVYERTLGFLDLAQEAANEKSEDLLRALQLKIQRMLLGLMAGLDLDAGEVAVNIGRLIEFSMDRTVNRDFAPAIRIIAQLRDTYVAIQAEVEELEESGALANMIKTEGIEIAV